MTEILDVIHQRFIGNFEADAEPGHAQEHMQKFMIAIAGYVADTVYLNVDTALQDAMPTSGINAGSLNEIGLQSTRCISRIVRELYERCGVPDDVTDEAEEAAVLACWARFAELKSLITPGGAA